MALSQDNHTAHHQL